MADGHGHGAINISYSIALLIITFLGIAVYNVIELTILIFTTFKKYSGLYFYSLLASSWGTAVQCSGFYLKYFVPSSSAWLYYTVILVGWTFMVTGQSIVLYSRLHLLYRTSADKATWVLYMIITNAIVWHISGFVIIYETISSHPKVYKAMLPVYEKLQMTAFFVQEAIISSLYVYKTLCLMRILSSIRGRNAQLFMQHLILVNVAVIVLDVTLLALEYANLYDIEVAYKVVVYTIKLKMEFAILNGLLDLFQGGTRRGSTCTQSQFGSPTNAPSASDTPLDQSQTITRDTSAAASAKASATSLRMNNAGLSFKGTNVRDMQSTKGMQPKLAREARTGAVKETDDANHGNIDLATFLRGS